jgi:hypothetical protein
MTGLQRTVAIAALARRRLAAGYSSNILLNTGLPTGGSLFLTCRLHYIIFMALQSL